MRSASVATRRRPSAATRALGNYSLGLGADVQQKYRFDLKYIDWIGHYRDNGTAVQLSTNGLTTFLRDRGMRQPDLQDHILRISR